MADLTAPLSTTKLAEKWGVHRVTAFRRLKRLRDSKGDFVFSQDGPHRPLRTSLRALNQADKHAVALKTAEKEEIEREVAALFRARIVAQEKSNKQLSDRVKSLEFQMKEMTETIEILMRGLRAVANGPKKSRSL